MTTGEEPADAACTVECIFSLSGRDFDPEECRREIGVEGATIWRQRRPHLLERTDLPAAAVNVAVGPDGFDTLDEPVRLALARVAPAAERVLACAARWSLKASVTCLVKVYTEPPLYVLAPETIRTMAALGAELSLDLIDLRET